MRVLPTLLALTTLTLVACHPGNQEARRLRDACNGGSAESCQKLALRLQNGEYVLKDPQHAVELFEQSCSKGLGDACVSLGLALQRGTGVDRDSVRPFK